MGLLLTLVSSVVADAAQRHVPVVHSHAPQLHQAPVPHESAPTAQAVRQPLLVFPVLGSVIGGVAGGLIGLAAWEVTTDCRGEFCGFGLAAYAGAGALAGVPLGAHLGNARRGNLLLDYLFAWLASGLAAVAFDRSSDTPSIVAVTHIAVSVGMERLLGALRER